MIRNSQRTIIIGVCAIICGIMTVQSLTHHSVIFGLIAGCALGMAERQLYLSWCEHREAIKNAEATLTIGNEKVKTIHGTSATNAFREMLQIKINCDKIQLQMSKVKLNSDDYRTLETQYDAELEKLDDVERKYFS